MDYGRRIRTKRKKKLKGLDKYVIFSISVLLVYTVFALWASFKGVTNDTLTTCIFGFFGGEVVTCALIKIFKLRGDDEKSKESDF